MGHLLESDGWMGHLFETDAPIVVLHGQFFKNYMHTYNIDVMRVAGVTSTSPPPPVSPLLHATVHRESKNLLANYCIKDLYFSGVFHCGVFYCGVF